MTDDEPSIKPTHREARRSGHARRQGASLPVTTLSGEQLLADPVAFAGAVRDILDHLHDAAWLAAHPLAVFAARARTDNARRSARPRPHDTDEPLSPDVLASSLADRARDAIHALMPAVQRRGDDPGPPGSPVTAGAGAPVIRTQVERSTRRAQAMRLRYLEAMPIPEILRVLMVGRSEFFRLQAEAIEQVAFVLRRSWDVTVRPVGDLSPTGPRPDGDPTAGTDVQVGDATPLIGREREIADVVALALRTRLATITGAPGAGKTRLALEAGRRLGASFPDGPVIVPLADLANDALVLPAIGRAFGIYDVPPDELESRLASTLRDRRVLLVLDNFEHVLGAGPQVARLTRTVPGLVVVTTSRAPLGVAGEQRFALEPLPVAPARARNGDLSSLEPSPAVELFINRARAIDPGFPHHQPDIDAAVAICRLLDGLPLAIELAAARLATLTAPTILARLGEAGTLATLGTGPRDAPARHRTLRGAIEWSHSLLSDDEVRTLATLSAFVGGASLPAVLDVAGRDDAPGTGPDPDLTHPAFTAAIDRLDALVTNNLVRRQALPDGGVRYGLLETVRAYGLELLQANGTFDDVRGRHAAYFLRFATRLAPHIRGGVSDHLIHEIDLELPNLRAALAYFIESGQPLLALDMIAKLEFFWWLQGYRLEGFAWLERTMDAAGDALQGDLRARALVMAGHLCALNGEDVRARDLAEEGLVAARRSGSTTAECDALHHLGVVARARGADRVASTMWQACARRSTEVGDHYREGISLWHLGMLAIDRLDPADADEWLEAGRHAFENHDLPIGRALVQYSEGASAMVSGDHGDARRLIEGAIRDLDTFGSATGVMYATGILAELEYLEWRLDAALGAAERSIDLMNGLGQTRGIPRNQITLGHVAAALGDRTRARRLYLEALRRSIPPGRLPNVAAALLGLAALTIADGEPDLATREEARRLVAASRALMAAIDRQPTLVDRANAARWLGGVFPAEPLPTIAGAIGVARAMAATSLVEITPLPASR